MGADWTSELIVPDEQGAAPTAEDHPSAVAPPGYRPFPRMTREQCAEAVRRGGWLFKADEGHDPDGSVPVEAVEGAWQVDAHGRPLRFRPNPRYGAPLPEQPVGDGAAPLPPLHAGRRPAGRALLGWLEDPQAPRLCRIAGSSGSGRSHLLHWLAAACPADSPHPRRRTDVLLSAAESTVDTFVWRLAALLGVSAADPDELVAALIDGVPRVLVVTDLDRAGAGRLSDAAQRIAAEVLRPLLRVPWLRLVVECASDTPAAAALDVPAAVLDLDQPQWTDLDAFTRWATALAERQLPAEVYPSPALALLAARTGDGVLLDPAATPARKAETLAETWWESLPELVRAPVVVLASVRGGLDTELWGELPGSLGPFAVHEAVDLLLPADPEGRYRVWPDAFAERLARSGLDHLSIRQNLLPEQPGPQDAARLDLVLRHAVRTSTAVDDLLADPAVLVHADPSAVGLALEHAAAVRVADAGQRAELAQAEARREALADGKEFDEELARQFSDADRAAAGRTPVHRAWRLAGPRVTATDDPAERASALHCWTVAHDGGLAERFAELAGHEWRARWAFAGGTDPVHLLARHEDRLAVAVGWDVVVLDPATGRSADESFARLTDRSTVALAAGHEGGAWALRRSGAVEELRPSSDAVRRLLAAMDDGATALAARGGEQRAVATGDASGRVHLLDDRDGTDAVHSDAPLHAAPVTAVDLAHHGGHHLLVSGGLDGAVQAWMPGRGPLSPPVPARDVPVTAVAVATTPGGLVCAAAWTDGLVRVVLAGAERVTHDLRLGAPAVGLALTDEGRLCVATATGVLGIDLTTA
ncbi:hypothetical protein TR51_18775 [Kitasatospora griseola]|uniref:Uncharacterized protein n=1 Tax=Kitasatospora griseola TaxID=2064 RepID=A0A0D0NC45_KITGR|nr:hypothetical protein [Kitasatospora griseola]KIQ65790.1 hypothetical protein TR51_18775 [Kitasatospora griseola]